jgi:hypothetical protein
MAAPIPLVIPGAAPVRDTRHQCEGDGCRISLPGSLALCRKCRKAAERKAAQDSAQAVSR